LSRASVGWGGRPLETTVVSSRELTPTTHDIMLEKPATFSFRPTQFTFLSLETEQGPETRPMSIATSPTRPNLEYAVRTGVSPFKRAFVSLRPGDKIRVLGPFGDFILREERPAVLVAGGIGITPLKGMAEYASDKHLPIPIRLVYSNRTREETPFRGELEELERRNPRFHILHTITGEAPQGWGGGRGRIGDRHLREAVEGLERPVYYICGKPSMVGEIVRLLSGSGVPDDDMMVEVFRGYRS
jgi:glycine betaine catabolism B